MQCYKIELIGITPLQQSRMLPDNLARTTKETWGDWEERVWENRANMDGRGRVIIPSSALKQALIASAQYTGEKIKGERNKTWTQKIKSGIGIIGDIVTNKKKGDWEKRTVDCSSDGTRNGGSKGSTRVKKHFPTFVEWKAEAELYVYDDIITKDVLERILDSAGKFIGLGTWRPENGGEYGRFEAKVKAV